MMLEKARERENLLSLSVYALVCITKMLGCQKSHDPLDRTDQIIRKGFGGTSFRGDGTTVAPVVRTQETSILIQPSQSLTSNLYNCFKPTVK